MRIIHKNKLPNGLWARPQRSGRTYYYYCFDRKQKEVALGADLTLALQRYHDMERDRLLRLYPRGIPILTLLEKFARTDPGSPTRHGQTRRKHELRLLRRFFSEADNPGVLDLPSQAEYQSWISVQKERTGLDTVRLFRRLWSLAQRHGYVSSGCPWHATHQQHERVLMELSDILYPRATPKLRRLLGAVLSSECPPSGQTAASRIDYQILEAELSITRIVILRTLHENLREDLVSALEKLSVADLIDITTSSSRAVHRPPGGIDLWQSKSSSIGNLREA